MRDMGADAALGTCRKLVIEPAKVALLFDYCPGCSLFFVFFKAYRFNVRRWYYIRPNNELAQAAVFPFLNGSQ